MNLKNKPPIFVPEQFQDEIEKLSKAALMDLVWDLATTNTGDPTDRDNIMTTFRERRDVILTHRNQAAVAWKP